MNILASFIVDMKQPANAEIQLQALKKLVLSLENARSMTTSKEAIDKYKTNNSRSSAESLRRAFKGRATAHGNIFLFK